MDYRVILSRPALRDLGEIARHIAQDNTDAALRIGGELVALAESLATLPRRGSRLHARPSTAPGEQPSGDTGAAADLSAISASNCTARMRPPGGWPR
ncbi:type II toxin-antitoxin system RelE/ParE family toxin [Termitidicoccus mucosus]|uniref:type II toxin-antitoxin system RelE/ParE family toxin n=1 Tax=Termitidicoccus mucosus TaxID=1184151 RepID=UPI000A0705C7